MFDIINIFQYIYGQGFAAIIIVLLAIVIYLVKKIATNHLHHIDMKLDVIVSSVNDANQKIDNMKLNCASHGERIAKVEGQLN
jgi:hypothetical protein